MVTKPSNHEICKRVAEAIELVRVRKMLLVNRHVYADLAQLDVDTEDYPPLLIELLQEIQAVGPVKCYAGNHPPHRTTDFGPPVDLFAYSWHSQRLGRQMYLKFGIKKECYCHVDCHESRPPKK